MWFYLWRVSILDFFLKHFHLFTFLPSASSLGHMGQWLGFVHLGSVYGTGTDLGAQTLVIRWMSCTQQVLRRVCSMSVCLDELTQASIYVGTIGKKVEIKLQRILKG